ncbi:MAG: methyltransferase domain-containing protein [Verrucomicrobia bacterium]|nr:methyltransferase domain-containing protein [Verrucomicrobiota bacterium]
MTPKYCEWDYTHLAEHYVYRPGYAPRAIDRILAVAQIRNGDLCCDIGAGTGKLTTELLRRGLTVDAVEPNQAMRNIGAAKTSRFSKVRWVVGTGESTGMTANRYSLVTYGSSFNTTQRHAALIESARILRHNAWFACLWNYRDRNDPIQEQVDSLICRHIPGFSRGSRSEDQTEIIRSSTAFAEIVCIEEHISHLLPTASWLNAWRSHATLIQQAGSAFEQILSEIKVLVSRLAGDEIQVPYVTRVWAAQVLKR